MPDPPIYAKRTHPLHSGTSGDSKSAPLHRADSIRYAELHCQTNFSFLRGASHPEELAERAAELGYAALAITDRNTLAGVVRMHAAAKACGLKLIVGAEITPVDAPSILLYATDRAAYGRLCRMITQGRLRSVKGSCRITLEDIGQWSDGLIGAICANDITQSDEVNVYRDIFRDRLYLAVSVHSGADDEHHLTRMNALSKANRIPLVATNDVYYHDPQRRFLQDVLTCIREHCTLESAGARLFANAERHLKSTDAMARLFAICPDAVARTIEIAERCTFSLDELRYEYPEALCPVNRTPTEYLAELTWAGAERRYPGELPEKVHTLLNHELALIRQLKYEPYFLTVWDIVQFARSRDILCQGRGSAANSAVCYCLGITSVDPDRIDLLFERFLSPERNEPPDIDVDFEHERREEVFQYIYGKYGREHAGIVAEVITYRSRSAIRDVGKALGLSLDRITALAKKHEWWDRSKSIPDEFLREAGFDPGERTIRLFSKLVPQLLGFPRHLSQHVGGFVITRGPLCEMVPIENAVMPDRTFIEWDKDDIDALGILKIDCLALGMLTAIRKTFHLVAAHENDRPLALHSIPAEDPKVYEMIQRADTVGVFQIESRAQMSMLPRLKPRNFYDLVIEVAIVRPGPIQGGMVHPYLRRRNGEEAVTYPNDAIKQVLHRTLGVPLFQEQAMRLAVVAAGFTPGEADQLRRAMAAWRRHGDVSHFRTKLIEGMKANGLSEEFAERCYNQICGFGEYGFPESHAASFALLVYVSAWLKRYHPAAFCAAILNSMPMGFYQPAQLVRDAREHGVDVLPVDVNESGYDCRLEGRGEKGAKGRRSGEAKEDPSRWGVGGPAVRLGMRLVKGISRAQVEGIEGEQSRGRAASVSELSRRTGAGRATLARLAAADAMRSMGLNRREALWQVLALGVDPELFRGQEWVEPATELPSPTDADIVLGDYATTGLSLHAHPLSLIRDDLTRLRVQESAVLRNSPQGRQMRVAGVVLVRQRPTTAGGIVFCTLEDEAGTANLIIPPAVYEKYRRAARGAAILIAEGRVERQGEVVHLHVRRLEDFSQAIRELASQSRDFH